MIQNTKMNQLICTFVAHHFERIHMFKVIFVATKKTKTKSSIVTQEPMLVIHMVVTQKPTIQNLAAT